MDWQIRPLAKESTISSEPFEVGEQIMCFLYRNEEGELERADVKAHEESNFPKPESVLGRWGRIVKDRTDEEREARQQMLASSEELFLSLFQTEEAQEEQEENEPDPDREAFKQVLGLMLERKRIIKSIERSKDGYQIYRHTKSKQEYKVSTADLVPEQLLRIQESLNALVL